MLYLFDEYQNSDHSARLAFFKPFIGGDTYLHEMSAKEITSYFPKMSKATIRQKVNAFNRYFNWLRKNGIPVETELSVSDFSAFKYEKQYIYSIDDFYDSWDKLIWAVKKCRAKNNMTYNEDNYVAIEVVCLLLWYGIKLEDIINIKLKDVIKTGISGYQQIQFDAKTLLLFQKYKSMTGITISRGTSEKDAFGEFTQDTFIRNIGKTPVDEQYIIVNLTRFITVEEEDKWLKNLFSIKNIYDSGMFTKIYNKLGGYDYTEKVKVGNYTRIESKIAKTAKELGFEFRNRAAESYMTKNFMEYDAERKRNNSPITLTPINEVQIIESSDNSFYDSCLDTIDMLENIIKDAQKKIADLRTIIELKKVNVNNQ